jgi:hypothetical protein
VHILVHNLLKNIPVWLLDDGVKGCPLCRRADVAVAFHIRLETCPAMAKIVMSDACDSANFVMQVWRRSWKRQWKPARLRA